MTRLPGKPARERSQRTSRDEQKERTRARIYQAAKELFIEKGYLQTRSQDIAKRAGVSQGAVHAHFPSKSDILSALMVDYLEHVDGELGRLDLYSIGCAEALRRAVFKVASLHAENMDQVNWYYGYAWIWGDGDETSYRRLMDRIHRRFCKILEDAVAGGEMAPETPVEMIVELLRGYYRSYLRRLRFAADKSQDFEEKIGRCIELLLAQYRTNPQ